MHTLAKAILKDDAAARFIAAADSGRCPALITGVGPSSRAHLAAAARVSLGRPVVVICSDEQEAARFMADTSGSRLLKWRRPVGWSWYLRKNASHS